MEGLKNYIGVKLLEAKPMTRGEYNDYRGWDIPVDENPDDPGYLAVYPDGYESWSPVKQFNEAYREMYLGSMNFGLAIEAMRKGLKVARHGWHGKDMFIYLQPGSVLDGPPRNEVLERYAETTPLGFEIKIGAHIDMKTQDGSIVIGWLTSQTDLLADDWFVVK